MQCVLTSIPKGEIVGIEFPLILIGEQDFVDIRDRCQPVWCKHELSPVRSDMKKCIGMLTKYRQGMKPVCMKNCYQFVMKRKNVNKITMKQYTGG